MYVYMLWCVVCGCVDGMNLKFLHYVGISTYQFIPCYASVIHKHSCILKPSENSKPTGLKVDADDLLRATAVTRGLNCPLTSINLDRLGRAAGGG